MIYDAHGNQYKNPSDAAKAKRTAERLACAHIGSQIKSNEELRDMLNQALPARRRDVYNMLFPYLKGFKVLGFQAFF
jgi:hypothetical protein